ncbi:hypothetical protein FEM48_Zijuj10G0120300 [Ziziphus jujuba var. spinosa]|uniref:Retrotransposon gag domain-containing protein n=1 Tax=Ziziphus jujuba var. spinosa TaxID=714518 RepID=A0A978UN95_ZIZJJ|nr:hypothetical protein FEM48_Zijuj10G0120300 [Ziziphus jujuba var. spinosa]
MNLNARSLYKTSNRLNGKNYLKWSQIVRTYLKGKGRLGHLLGTRPAKEDPTFEAWDEEDSMIMSWLWDSMEPTISDTCMFFTTAKEIWDCLHRTCSKARNTAQVYEIKVKAGATKQGDKSVTEYANLLQNLWQELDYYQVIEMKCHEDAVSLKNFIEKDRVYDFLAGLNPEFDQVRIQIIGKDCTPSLEETISLIRAEESQRSVMLEPQTMEGSALAAKIDHQDKEKGDLPKFPEQPKSEENSAIGGLNSEELEKLRGLLGSLDKPSGTCSLALSIRVVEPESSSIPASESSPIPVSESSPIPASVTQNFQRFSQVYSRRKAAPELTQVQESNLNPDNGITVRSDPLLQASEISNQDLPIAVRKA